MHKKAERKSIEIVLLTLSGILAVGILLVMNLWLIPRIEQNAGGLRVFDLNTFGYSFDTAKEFVRRLSPAEKTLYLHAQLPLDFLCPICYGGFFYLVLKRVCRRKIFPVVAPAIVMAFDYAENICALRMLTTDFGSITATVGSICTTAKSVTMCLLFLVTIALLLRKAKNRRHGQDI